MLKDKLTIGVVAPPVGAWIEIVNWYKSGGLFGVAPPVGAWIEIFSALQNRHYFLSLPPWERGLKSQSTEKI